MSDISIMLVYDGPNGKLYHDAEFTQGVTKDELIEAFNTGIAIDNGGVYVRILGYELSKDGTYAFARAKNGFVYYTSEYVTPSANSKPSGDTGAGDSSGGGFTGPVKWDDIIGKPMFPLDYWVEGYSMCADLTFDSDGNCVTDINLDDVVNICTHDMDSMHIRTQQIMSVDGVTYENSKPWPQGFSNDNCPITIRVNLDLDTGNWLVSVSSKSAGTYHVEFGHRAFSYTNVRVLEQYNDSATGETMLRPTWTSGESLQEVLVFIKDIVYVRFGSHEYSLVLGYYRDSELGWIVETVTGKYKVAES